MKATLDQTKNRIFFSSHHYHEEALWFWCIKELTAYSFCTLLINEILHFIRPKRFVKQLRVLSVLPWISYRLMMAIPTAHQREILIWQLRIINKIQNLAWENSFCTPAKECQRWEGWRPNFRKSSWDYNPRKVVQIIFQGHVCCYILRLQMKCSVLLQPCSACWPVSCMTIR